MSAQDTADSPILIAPLEQHRIDATALARWLSDALPEAAAGVTVAQFQGGMSNPTYRLTLRSGRHLVLRKKPPGDLLPRAHAVDREYRVMKALADTAVPVPEMIDYCDDPGVIGAEFFVMDHVEGRIIPSPAMGPVDRADRRDLAFSVVDTLADRGLRVICAGLDQDWRGRPFEPMPHLMAVAEYVTKTMAVCMVCGAPANRSQRLVQRDMISEELT